MSPIKASPEQMPALPKTKKSRRLNPRHRRVLWSAMGLAVAGLLGTVLVVKFYGANQPEVYRSSEEIAGITNTMDRGATNGKSGSGRALPAGAPEPRFSDVTRDAGLAEFRSFEGNRTSQLPEDMGSGVAWGDFDNDGNDDLFVVSAGGALDLPANQRAPSLLFRNMGNGTFTKVENFPDIRIMGMGAAWGDYNNDGWLDLVVTGYEVLMLFRNDRGVLAPDPRSPNLKGFWTGAAWGDYDRDGSLDLYVCGYIRYKPDGNNSQTSEQFGLEVPFTLNPSSYEAERNLLFHNNGLGTFIEVAEKLGVANPSGRSLSALWHDFDSDGWLDLYIANDISENKLYLNKQGRFVDAGSAAWVAEYRGSMGLAAGDFNLDGADDLFISHWIAQQYALYQSLLEAQKSAAKQNKSDGKANANQLHFTDVAEVCGIGPASLQSIGWGTSFVDFDSDGWLDLVVANGSTFETKQRPAKLEPMPSFLFWNQKGEFFRDLAPWNAVLSTPRASRGLAVADFNNDGAMDMAIVDHGEGVRLVRNDVAQGNWLEIRLRSRVGRNRQPVGFGDGATVIAHVGGLKLRRTVTSASYLSQDTRLVHFGLGTNSKVDKIEVRWLGGRVETYSNLEANTNWNLIEGDPVAHRKPVEAPQAAVLSAPSRDQLVQFWGKQRAAMDALKRENDLAKAAHLFREAVALNPTHEDSLYYLANCLYAQGDTTGALEQLEVVIRTNPQSHRGYQRKGLLLAASSNSRKQLNAAEESVKKALALNPEETGALLLLGEIALLKGDPNTAAQRLELACRTNPRAVGGYFLRGYIAWKSNDAVLARELLRAAKNARGNDWKPKGTVAEGDVRARMYTEGSVLSRFWNKWDGSPNLALVYATLDRALKRRSVRSTR
jgi:tetratricopeptide (TPR) repeat protein